jgi:hypothetical protein
MDEDNWNTEGVRITDPANLERLKHILEEESPLLVEHRFYRGSGAPDRFVCTNFETLERHLKKAAAGDSFWFWSLEDCCRDDNSALHGKVPDAAGRVPEGGAY